MAKRISNIVLEDVNIPFKNFQGKKTEGNPQGRRQFCVKLDWDLAQKLKNDGWNVKVYSYNEEEYRDLLADGWNVKFKRSDDPDRDALVFLQVTVRFDNYPPKIIMRTKKNEVFLDESGMRDLDESTFSKVNVIINPYSWKNTRGEEGITAYLNTLYVVVDERPLDRWRNDYPIQNDNYPIQNDDYPF